jgi:hypothetical protein
MARRGVNFTVELRMWLRGPSRFAARNAMLGLRFAAQTGQMPRFRPFRPQQQSQKIER